MVPHTCGKLQALRGLGFVVLVLGAGIAAAARGAAGGAQDLLVTSSLERAPVDAAAVPGAGAPQAEAIIVSVRFTNSSTHVIDSIRVTSAVPPDAEYLPGSASAPGAEVLFSADGGRSFGRPDELAVDSPDGSVRLAAPAEYTHIRWILRAPLDAGATGIARFRAVPR